MQPTYRPKAKATTLLGLQAATKLRPTCAPARPAEEESRLAHAELEAGRVDEEEHHALEAAEETARWTEEERFKAAETARWIEEAHRWAPPTRASGAAAGATTSAAADRDCTPTSPASPAVDLFAAGATTSAAADRDCTPTSPALPASPAVKPTSPVDRLTR